MTKVSITRMELLAHKEQIGLAEQGMELLKQKRSALLRELLETVDHILTRRETLQETAIVARQLLARAEAVLGSEGVGSVTMATHDTLQLDIQFTNVMGVRVPIIEQKRASRSLAGRGYAFIGLPIILDETASAYEAVVDELIVLANSELRLQRLAKEVQRTTRRANALEHQLLPRLKAERDQIEIALSERERTDHFRLKQIKKKRKRKAARSRSTG